MKFWYVFVSDIDVHNPDEKSLITYVSSLYDVFPVVPTVEQSLRDNVSVPPLYTHFYQGRTTNMSAQNQVEMREKKYMAQSINQASFHNKNRSTKHYHFYTIKYFLK